MSETPERGETGKTGLTGKDGTTGRTGRTGVAGKDGSDPTRRLALLFAFLAIIAVTYGIVLQQADGEIEENTARIEQSVNRTGENLARIEDERLAVVYESCQNDLQIQGQYNSLLASLIRAEEDGIALDPDNEPLAAVRQARIAAYQAGMINPPICEPIAP